MPSGGHGCSAPVLCCKTREGPEDSHLGELRPIWGGDSATKDGPVRAVPQSPSLLRVREGNTRATVPGLGTTLWSHCSTAVGAPHLRPHPEHHHTYWLLLPEGARQWMSSREHHSGTGWWLS